MTGCKRTFDQEPRANLGCSMCARTSAHARAQWSSAAIQSGEINTIADIENHCPRHALGKWIILSAKELQELWYVLVACMQGCACVFLCVCGCTTSLQPRELPFHAGGPESDGQSAKSKLDRLVDGWHDDLQHQRQWHVNVCAPESCEKVRPHCNEQTGGKQLSCPVMIKSQGVSGWMRRYRHASKLKACVCVCVQCNEFLPGVM